MRTENPQTKEFRRGIGRARVLMSSGLGRLTGSPLGASHDPDNTGVQWLMVPQAPRHDFQAITIDAEELRAMEQSLVQLAKHYRPHLSKLVPKPESWLKRIGFALELLKRQFRHPQTSLLKPNTPKEFERLLETFPLPQRFKQRTVELARLHPRLLPLLSAVAFTELTKVEESDFRQILWIEQHSYRLASLSDRDDSLGLQLALCRMHAHIDETWLNFLFDVLIDPILSTAKNSHPFYVARVLLNRLLETFDKEPLDQPLPEDGGLIADRIRVHILWLFRQTSTKITNLSQLLGHLVGSDLTVHFVKQTLAAQVEERLFERTLKQVLHTGAQNSLPEFGNSLTEWSNERRSPLADTPSGICELLRLLPFLEYRVNNKRIRRMSSFFMSLSGIPAHTRIRMLEYWIRRGNHYGHFRFTFDQFLPVLAKLFQRRAVHFRLLTYWEQTTTHIRGTSDEFIANLVNSECGRNVMLGVVQLIERLIYDQEISLPNSAIGELPNIVAAAPNLQLAEAFVRQRLEKGDETSVSSSNLALAFWLSPCGAFALQNLAGLDEDPGLATAVRAIQGGLSDPDLCELVRKHAIGEHKQLVIRVGASVALLVATNATASDREMRRTNTDWIKQYPIGLHDSLLKLTKVCENAERAAASTLSEACRPSDCVERELNALKRIVADPSLSTEKRTHLEQRIANLEARAQTGHLLSPTKLKRLQAKLEHRYDQELVDDFDRRVAEAAKTKLAEFGFTEFPERILQMPNARIIPAISRQTQVNRQIAFKALGKSCHDTLTLASEPANECYLNCLRSYGINLEPWLSEQIVLHGKREDGTPYRVQFTRDPFDIFLMGFHFDTCLSPHSFNFYSTIANLVDANKRVLYGRTESGQVVGRCLFALTTHGKIQTFQRYSHSKEDGFAELVEEFARKLAAAMKTTLTQFGRIPCLVSREWYDDGCIPINTEASEAFEKLNENLLKCSDNEAYSQALTILGDRQRVVEATEAIVNTTVPQRPVIAPSLFQELSTEPQVPALVRLRLAAYTYQVGEPNSALTIFESVRPEILLKSLGRTKLQELMQDKSVLDLLLAHDPVLTRRLLYRSRPCNIRCDHQESNPVRREALAHIYRILNRPTSARLLSSA